MNDDSVARIRDLHIAEKKLVLLVETASQALALLSDDGPTDEDSELAVHERSREFKDLVQRYFSLVNDIQLSIRGHTHFLTQTASLPTTTKSITFRSSVTGQQKELEIWINALQLIQQRIRSIQQAN
ncbi:hypothetical protein BC940DRAFT_299895 [Gongronella butleri]|nr:hypothetical protein BC940DRAFT_299895 [Gongronella butleri]